MIFKTINIKEIKKDVTEISNEDIINEYKIRCYSGRTDPRGIKENGFLFTNGDYIKILVSEIKKKKFTSTSFRN